MAAEPLLGTPYLVSQSHSSASSTERTRITPSLCSNLSAFKSLLAQSRKLDDAITTRLNRASALARSHGQPGGGECQAVWEQLVERWGERGEVLAYCDRVLAEQGQGTRKGKERMPEEKGLSADVGELGRGRLAEDDIKRRQLVTELSVESIIRARSLSFFLSRCPDHPQDHPPLPELPKLGADDETEEERRRRRGRDARGGVRWGG
ncbi:hypothetical protein JCM21900_002877 [Sporobolomyces salmonicolor]